MKNITLAVDEDVLDRVRVIAAERKTTVNGLVREYLGRSPRSRTGAPKHAAAYGS